MEYKGRLFGKVDRTYFPLESTTDDFETLESMVSELENKTATLQKEIQKDAVLKIAILKENEKLKKSKKELIKPIHLELERWKHLYQTESKKADDLVNQIVDLNKKVGELNNLPENLPLYKDSGLWQLRSDDMETVLIQQGCNESANEFLERCRNYEDCHHV